MNGEFPTIIGADAKFKGELSFDKGVRVEGTFSGHIKSKGTLHIAEGARVDAQSIEAANVKVEGECKGNVFVSEKLHLMATAKVEGDLRTTRLEIADGAIFSGNVVVGQGAAEAGNRRPTLQESSSSGPTMASAPTEVVRTAPSPSLTAPSPAPRPRPQEIRVAS
ncbi:MAG TPA: polymer-forming cytoskeletal protein [Phycisphaerae bacterium]|nr:polymer-forming cytoskeletal protein [Phycisphaerae bacterium]